MTEATVMPAAGAIYRGQVMHQRLRPYRRHFSYRVFALLLDLDRLDELSKALSTFSHNRFNLLSFHDRDHGPRDGGALRPWLAGLLHAAGMPWDDGRVMLLCYPRVLGYVFNPLSTYFCQDASGRLVALVHEVRNTFGEMHCYVLPVDRVGRRGLVRQTCHKRFYVSPFIGMQATYRFAIRPPDAHVSVVIAEDDPEGPLLSASFVGKRQPLDNRHILGSLLRLPLLTLKVTAGIHWEALWIWLKGARFHSRPAAPPSAASFGPDSRPLGKAEPSGTPRR